VQKRSNRLRLVPTILEHEPADDEQVCDERRLRAAPALVAVQLVGELERVEKADSQDGRLSSHRPHAAMMDRAS